MVEEITLDETAADETTPKETGTDEITVGETRLSLFSVEEGMLDATPEADRSVVKLLKLLVALFVGGGNVNSCPPQTAALL